MRAPEPAPLTPNCRTTLAGMRLISAVIFNVHQAHVQSGSLLVSSFKHGNFRIQSQYLSTSQPPENVLYNDNFTWDDFLGSRRHDPVKIYRSVEIVSEEPLQY
ncbi:hypothetical protein AVEN_99782-1 [Araneus ventricosus]|uniref:Uncharacterized protein n=1 Tax=Araneus ventricosus TaxID=182803 RepID=A0A4Y2SCL4_ARAVE|nr:hypothetical protein AVEN_99782-1 [Araneus ventricosus]